MSIIYYPWRTPRAKKPVVDYLMNKSAILTSNGSFDLSGGALEEIISHSEDWTITSIALSFSAAVSKTYTVSVINGMKVVEGLNDYLWFIATDFFPTKITLDEGFYDGDELAAHLKTKLDAAFSPATFTIVYDSTTASKFTITASAGNIKYIEFNLQGYRPYKQSIAGHLFGFYEDTAFASVIESDTEVPALTLEVPTSTDSDTLTSVYFEGDRLMDLDQALKLDVTSAAAVVNWSVTYKERA
jgi:hypothetical protein